MIKNTHILCIRIAILLVFAPSCNITENDGPPSPPYDPTETACSGQISCFNNLRDAADHWDSVVTIGIDNDSTLQYSPFFRDSMTIFPRLRSLRLRYLSMPSLPSKIYEVATIERLFLYNTGISYLSDSLGILRSLQDLIIFGAHLPVITDSIRYDTAITRIILRYADIEQFPVAFTALPKLVSLDLSNNSISDLPESIKKLKRLRLLALMDNPIPDSVMTLVRKWLPNTDVLPRVR
jgi:Leucine-rich repeat (LRR) protein